MDTKQCPYCGQTIVAAARKCRYCRQWLDDTLDNVQAQAPVPPVPTQPYTPAGTNPGASEYPTQPSGAQPSTPNTQLSTPPRKPVGFFERYFLMTFVRPYADFGGYTSRKEYWLTVVTLYIFSFAVAGLGFLITALAGAAGWIVAIVLWGIFGLAFCIPSWAILCRRLRDGGFSPWLILLFLIPGIGALIIFILTLLPSKYRHERVPMRFGWPDWVITLLGPVMFAAGIVFFAGSISHRPVYYDSDNYSSHESSVRDSDFELPGIEEEAPVQEVEEATEAPAQSSEGIVGNWMSEQGGKTVVACYTDFGTYQFHVISGSSDKITHGEYTFNGDYIITMPSGSSRVITDRIVFLSDNALKVANGGTITTFYRISDERLLSILP